MKQTDRKTELTAKYEHLKYMRFMLNMKDRWNQNDFARSYELTRQIAEVRDELDSLTD